MLDHRGVEVPTRLSRRGRDKALESVMRARHERVVAASKTKETAAGTGEPATGTGSTQDAQPDSSVHRESAAERALNRCAMVIAIPAIAVGFFAGLATLLVVIFGPGYLIGRAVGVSSGVTFAATVGVLVIAILVFRAVNSGTRDRHLIYSMLESHLCPACGYSLRDLRPDAQTPFVTCPECGAGWKLPRLTTPGCTECGHALTGEVVDDSGYVSCPECGSAHLPISEDQLRGTAFDPASYSADGARPLE